MAYTFKHGDRPIDGYTIQRAVGRGGFGEVYYAISDGGREVAIKYLRDNPQVELRGVSNCINLKSPHLVAIFDVKQTVDGEYGIIMEYCSGPSLRDLLIAEPNGFAPQKAAFFVREIAKGLTYLHDRGIVHRDLKPGNIFYDDGYVKIGDYGLSKFIAVSRHSGQTASVGTVHYMAPEIGSGNYSRGVDIYALGVMLYEMLLGRVPFEGSSMAEVLMKHLTTQPELDDLPQPFGKVIRKALEKDPNDRYQTVDEMVDDLLEVEEVRESLAGFSTKSLEGAVHRHAPQRHDSPVPSPNPARGFAPPFGQTPGRVGQQPPFAEPIGGGDALTQRINKKMDRISHKLDAKMAKLGGRPVPPPPPPTRGSNASIGGGQVIPVGDRRKRMLLSGLLSLGLAIGLGILVGANSREEAGVAAGMSVIMLSASILLSRSAVGWFGVQHGPQWSQKLIYAGCSAPLVALGAAPLIDVHEEEGAAVFLGLLALSVLGRWERTIEDSSGGEMSIGRAVRPAFLALIFTAIAGAMFDAEIDDVMMMAAGVGGAVGLVMQATAWWLPAKAARAFQQMGIRDAEQAGDSGDQPMASTPPAAPMATPTSEQPMPPTFSVTPGAAELTRHPRERWGVTRAFWSLAAFLLMGGAIVSFLVALIARKMPYDDVTGVIIACTACFAFMIFALRKTTPLKRDGFWRESLRPFLISATMFGIGGTITGIARHWNCGFGDDERIGCTTGLVLCSLMFLGLSLFTGRRRRQPKPFLQGSVGQVAGSAEQAVSDPQQS